LVEIFRDLNDFSFNEIKLEKIERNIDNCLVNWKLLYVDESSTERILILPKQHFMIHYTRAIREFGPPSTYSTMRFESKHSYFKRLSHVIHNKINITLSLSRRHQMLQLYELNGSSFSNEFELGPTISQIDDVHFFSIFNLIKTVDSNLNETDFTLYNHAKYNSIQYGINDIIICKKKILKIKEFFKCKNIHYLLAEPQVIVAYRDYLTGFVVNEFECPYQIINMNELHNVFPIDLYQEVKLQLLDFYHHALSYDL
jgi:hypothetical protein